MILSTPIFGNATTSGWHSNSKGFLMSIPPLSKPKTNKTTHVKEKITEQTSLETHY